AMGEASAETAAHRRCATTHGRCGCALKSAAAGTDRQTRGSCGAALPGLAGMLSEQLQNVARTAVEVKALAEALTRSAGLGPPPPRPAWRRLAAGLARVRCGVPPATRPASSAAFPRQMFPLLKINPGS